MPWSELWRNDSCVVWELTSPQSSYPRLNNFNFRFQIRSGLPLSRAMAEKAIIFESFNLIDVAFLIKFPGTEYLRFLRSTPAVGFSSFFNGHASSIEVPVSSSAVFTLDQCTRWSQRCGYSYFMAHTQLYAVHHLTLRTPLHNLSTTPLPFHLPRSYCKLSSFRARHEFW